MSQDQKVTLHFQLSDETTKDVSFVIPGGADGMLPPVTAFVDGGTATSAEFNQFLQDMLANPGIISEPTSFVHTQTINGVDRQSWVTQYGVGDEGNYIFVDGYTTDTKHQIGLYWIPAGGTGTYTSVYSFDSAETVVPDVTQTLDTTTTDYQVAFTAYTDAVNSPAPATPQNYVWTALQDPGGAAIMDACLTVTPTQGGKYVDFFIHVQSTAVTQLTRLWANDDGTEQYTVYDWQYSPPSIPASKTLKRSGSSGNFSFGYGDQPQNNSACGLYGTGIYLKTTLTLNSAPNGDNSPVVICRLSDLPCMQDGTLVAYNIWADYVWVSGQNKPTVSIWLNFPVPPTYLIDPVTKEIKMLTRATGQGSGLASVYPESGTGNPPNEFQYVMQYFYTA